MALRRNLACVGSAYMGVPATIRLHRQIVFGHPANWMIEWFSGSAEGEDSLHPTPHHTATPSPRPSGVSKTGASFNGGQPPFGGPP